MLPLSVSRHASVLPVAGLCLLISGCSQSVVSDYGPGTDGIQVNSESSHPLLGDWVRMDDTYAGTVVRFEQIDDQILGTVVYASPAYADFGWETGHLKIRDVKSVGENVYHCRNRNNGTSGYGDLSSHWFENQKIELRGDSFIMGAVEGTGGSDQLSQRYQRLEANGPDYAALLFGLCELARQRSDNDLLAEAAKLLVSQKELLSAANLNNLAWALATTADSRKRHPDIALTLAREACQKEGFRNASYVDTLAAAYAAVGEWDEAIKYQQQACGNVWVDGADTRLRLYQEERAYVQGMLIGPQTAGGDSVPGSL